MARRLTQELAFSALAIEGGLLAPDFLNKVARLEASEQSEADYDVPRGLKLRDEIGRYWKIAQNLWQDFDAKRRRSDLDTHAITVREFLEPLCRQVLGFSDLRPIGQVVLDERVFPIGFSAGEGRVPVIFAAYDQGLDKPSSRHGDGIRRRSPFLLAQECLNACEQALWAVVSNGLKFRVLRDNPSLTRPAYIEADLEAIFSEGLYPDFTALWLLTHGTRFGKVGAEPADCPIERWRNTAQEDGVRARDRLRVGVTEALRALGTGFIAHSANSALRKRIEAGELSTQTYFEQLLRLIYRLIFLATIEDRELVFAPDASAQAKTRYQAGYSLQRLRQLAARRRSYDRHFDLWQVLTITVAGLSNGQAALGLPALGGLFDAGQCPDLDRAVLENQALLSALFSLCFFREGAALSRVNYRDMDSEELGSVYESLLELVPVVTLTGGARTFRFIGDDDEGSTKGNARKLTGSYYTPDTLVQELIKSALEPVIEQTLKANPREPVKALLDLTVCDPACGSGHFLLAAARRIAEEVARLNAADGNPLPEDYRHALRDVVAHCVFGVDKNPMAVELSRMALWLEAYTPDRPLTFLDHHLQCGDALLGVLDPKILEGGIPDEAFAALSGDDKPTASALKKQNKADLRSWKSIAAGDLFTKTGLASQADSVEHLADDNLTSIAAKRDAWKRSSTLAKESLLAKLADTYVAAFLAPKVPAEATRVPLSGYLWGLSTGQVASQDIDNAASAICARHGVFHWWLAFPQIAAKGGFSVMLGNPPWERIKLQEEEFFANRSPLVAMAKNKAQRADRIELLQQGLLLHTLYPDVEAAEGLSPPNQAEMQLYEAFIEARRGAEAASLFAHDSRRYPLTGLGDVNTYALFAETFLQLVSQEGRAGFIVPLGIATDDNTSQYFETVSEGRLVSMFGFRTGPGMWADVGHQTFRFCLVTIGNVAVGKLSFNALSVDELHDERRVFSLSPDDFRLINPNTRTCPVFRSQRDAELTKKLYRAAPVLIEEGRSNDDGNVLDDVNPWGIRFFTMFHMSADSSVFRDEAAGASDSTRLPLYEAKMIHQFDHRWATYVDAFGKPDGLDTEDCTESQKRDPRFTVRPRYWVDERLVLARIARVPGRIASAWLATHAAGTGEPPKPEKSLEVAIASWVAGELFRRAAGTPDRKTGWSGKTLAQAFQTAQSEMELRFSRLAQALRGVGIDGKKSLSEFPRWATLDAEVGLSDRELSDIEDWSQRQYGLSDDEYRVRGLLDRMDCWMDARSPKWLMGWRDISKTQNERTLIASVMPRVCVGHTLPLLYTCQSPSLQAALLANWSSLVFDYVVRQKVGGTHLTYGYLKQFPVLPPDRYSKDDLEFIVPRVLELTYTADDLKPWAEDLDYRAAPFSWDQNRREQLRAELDAYFARLYGLNREELRFILEPADAMGADYPSETFRVLKTNETRQFGEYRTQRLVLDAWDRLASGDLVSEPIRTNGAPVVYSELAVIRTESEAELAGLIAALVAQYENGISVASLQDVVARTVAPGYAELFLEPKDAERMQFLVRDMSVLTSSASLAQIPLLVRRLEGSGAIRPERKGVATIFVSGASPLPTDVRSLPEHPELAGLMFKLEARRELARKNDVRLNEFGERGTDAGTGTR
ncbi:Eco57I restriction-modification methylase domain-containing protein [Paraburkholderia graminis]|uniref:Eco57I restriction-modification methylase domain-containing protein n=1 Tax=Paraburkholderia graminis TaxID=60548 RepID=UPI000DEEF77E|nr:N-6 DNA methylase [Paraburkholderia graminis]